jgi:WD40 repeat protein
MRMVHLFSLTKSILSNQGIMDKQISDIFEFYGFKISELIDNFSIPSLSFTIKYWQDQIPEVQQSARSVFHSAFKLMKPDIVNALIFYWHPYLPTSTLESITSSDKLNAKATIVLGMFSIEGKDVLSQRMRSDVAEALVNIINKEDMKQAYKLSCVEILGRGFNNWEPHLNGTNIIRQLLTMTYQVSKNRAMSVMARQALLLISSSKMSLIVNTMMFDLVHSKVIEEKIGMMKVLGWFINKKPVLIYPYLNHIIDSIVKSLDPNIPNSRDHVIDFATMNLADLIRLYPNITFHGNSQKLAIGSSDGMTVVYDLKTALKLYMIQSHSKPVVGVSYSPDGKLLVTYSIQENLVKFWQPSTTGIFNMFFRGDDKDPKNETMKSFRNFSVGELYNNDDQETISISQILDSIKFEWSNERTVLLKSIKGFQITFTV